MHYKWRLAAMFKMVRWWASRVLSTYKVVAMQLVDDTMVKMVWVRARGLMHLMRSRTQRAKALYQLGRARLRLRIRDFVRRWRHHERFEFRVRMTLGRCCCPPTPAPPPWRSLSGVGGAGRSAP